MPNTLYSDKNVDYLKKFLHILIIKYNLDELTKPIELKITQVLKE